MIGNMSLKSVNLIIIGSDSGKSPVGRLSDNNNNNKYDIFSQKCIC